MGLYNLITLNRDMKCERNAVNVLRASIQIQVEKKNVCMSRWTDIFFFSHRSKLDWKSEWVKVYLGMNFTPPRNLVENKIVSFWFWFWNSHDTDGFCVIG